MNTRGKTCFEKQFFEEAGPCFETKGHQEHCRIALLGSHRIAHFDNPIFTYIFLYFSYK